MNKAPLHSEKPNLGTVAMFEKSAAFRSFRTAFSGPFSSFLVTLTAIAGRCIQLVFFYNIRVDASYQVMATDNFLHGHGISTAQVFPENLADTVYTPLTQWPPGYSLLLAPFYALFQHQYIAAGLAVDMIAAISLVLVLRKLLLLFELPDYLVNLFTLINGFFIYYFYFIASSDAIAILFFVCGIYLALRLIKEDRAYLQNSILLVASLFMAALIKYLFIPVVFFVPAYLVFVSLMRKNSGLRNAGIFSFLVLFVLTASLLLYTKSLSGSVAYVSSPERGFFPGHLLETYPFLTASFIKPDTLTLLFGGSFMVSYRLSQWLTVLLAIFLISVFVSVVRRKTFAFRLLADDFYLLSFLLSLAVFLVLAALSLMVAKEEILPKQFWTYVEEARYYGLVYILVQVGVFAFYQHVRQKGKGSRKIIFVFLVFLLLPEAFRGLLFDVNRIRNFRREEYSWQYEKRLQDYADSLIRQDRKLPVVIAGSAYYYNHRITLASHVPVLYDQQSLQRPGALNTTAPVRLLIMLQQNAIPSYRAFLDSQGLQPIGRFDQFVFYSLHVQPR